MLYRSYIEAGTSSTQLHHIKQSNEEDLIMKYIVVIFVLFVLVATPARSDFKEGMSAYERKDLSEAYREFQESADRGDDDAQYMMGILYAEGSGVPQNYVEAYKWFNLSAAQDNRKAKAYREKIGNKMTTEQIALAQKLSSTWEPTASAKEEKAALKYKEEEVQDIVDRLREVLIDAERKRASESWVIDKLWELVRQYDWPWRQKLLQDRFSDGDYTNNPNWTVASGKFSVESGIGLHSIFSAAKPKTEQEPRERKRGDIGRAILEAIIEQQSTTTQSDEEKEVDADYAEIYITRNIANAFALRFTVKSDSKEGRFEFGPYQGEDRDAGYRLAYTPGSENGFELLRFSPSRSAIVEIYGEVITLEDGQAHIVEMTRDSKGEMAVSVDGRELFRVTDRGITDEFDGFTIVNRGGDYSLGEITIFGIEQSD
jgi:TPR repeat protein